MITRLAFPNHRGGIEVSTLINLDFHRWPFRYFRKRRQEFIDSHREELKGSRFHSRLWHQYGYWLWQITRYEFKIARIKGGLAIGEFIIRFGGGADRIFG